MNCRRKELEKKHRMEGGSDWNRFTFWQGKYEVEIVEETTKRTEIKESK